MHRVNVWSCNLGTRSRKTWKERHGKRLCYFQFFTNFLNKKFNWKEFLRDFSFFNRFSSKLFMFSIFDQSYAFSGREFTRRQGTFNFMTPPQVGRQSKPWHMYISSPPLYGYKEPPLLIGCRYRIPYRKNPQKLKKIQEYSIKIVNFWELNNA